MVQTIESFINRLQTDGVEAGREAADKIRQEAEQEAQSLLAAAREQAAQIVAQAQAEGEKIQARANTELQLAARDAVQRLQETLNRALQAVLFGGVQDKLEDGDFLGTLIRDVVMRYVAADQAGHNLITVNVSEKLRQELLARVLAPFSDRAAAAPSVDVRGTLAEAGFEYTVADGTVEVTVDSVVEVLSEMVDADLRKRIDAVAGLNH